MFILCTIKFLKYLVVVEAKQWTEAMAASALVDRHRVQLTALACGAIDADAELSGWGAVVEVLLGVHSHVSPGLRACVSKRAPLALAAAPVSHPVPFDRRFRTIKTVKRQQSYTRRSRQLGELCMPVYQCSCMCLCGVSATGIVDVRYGPTLHNVSHNAF